jgi:hypothetical protein
MSREDCFKAEEKNEVMDRSGLETTFGKSDRNPPGSCSNERLSRQGWKERLRKDERLTYGTKILELRLLSTSYVLTYGRV